MKHKKKLRQEVTRHCAEWAFKASHSTPDPFNDTELDVVFSHEDGQSWRVPAFWSGGKSWRVRFTPPLPGRYEMKCECSRADDTGLNGETDEFVAIGALSKGTSYVHHGALRISENKRHFEHEDGTPFFWLADTWWMGLTKRLQWPGDFQKLTANRVKKGFTVVQIVAGLYPDMPWGDERGWNEAGMPYNQEMTIVNPKYFDEADKKIGHIVSHGMIPCIVGSWGYFLMQMGVEKAKKHWRYLIARWGALPVVWCVAGEGKMAYYLSENPSADAEAQKTGWTEVARYIRATDPMHRLITIHPTDKARDQVTDDSVIDFDMLQTGHGNFDSIPISVAMVRDEYNREPTMPVIDSEVNYEGIMASCYDDVQRLAFWACMLSGAAGHTYGANGIWQVNTAKKPYGPSPHGNNWGNRPWGEAMTLPGSLHVAIGKRILQQFRWWEFTPHQEWVSPSAGPADAQKPYAAGIPGEVRVIYSFRPVWGIGLKVCDIEPGVNYTARFINPSTGAEHALGKVKPAPDNSWQVPQQPEMRDWVLVLERARKSVTT